MQINKHFNTLNECVSFIREHYPDTSTTRITAKDIENPNDSNYLEVPKYFYRGESKAYKTTLSTIGRLIEKDPPHLSLKLEILHKINTELQEFLNLNELLSEAFMQHYEVPTEMFDMTRSIDVASYFASNGEFGDKGLLGIFSTENIYDKTIIIDLTTHPKAERPRRQMAYGLKSRKFKDIKTDQCQQELNIKWFSFFLDQKDIQLYNQNTELLNAFSDKMAGAIQLIVDSFDKMDDTVAKWLSETIIPAPFVSKVIEFFDEAKEQPKSLELVSSIEAGEKYNVEEERLKNYIRWSNLYPETRKFKM